MRRLILFVTLLALLTACAGSGAAMPTVGPTPPPTVAPASAAPTPTPQILATAPGLPAGIDLWTSGDKLGVGTAYTYEQPPGDANPSRVWFTLTAGAITDLPYPNVSQANVKALHLVVTDGATFVADEMTDATWQVERLDGRAPAFRVTSTDTQGRWQAVKEVATDPQSDALLFTVAFTPLQGRAEDYRLFLVYTPRLGNSGARDLSRVGPDLVEAWDERAEVATALLGAAEGGGPGWRLATTGYTGRSDLLTDLRDNFRVDTVSLATNQPGRLSAAVELATTGATTLALGFGPNLEVARAAAQASLDRGFAAVAADYLAGWNDYLDRLDRPANAAPLYDWSLAVIKTHEDKINYGAGVASLSTPWGHFQPDAESRQRGYRYVWPRDLYHTASALLAAGDAASARQTLAYLDEVLQLANGSFPQNAFPDGRLNWTGLQLDQVAAPIILAWKLDAVDRYASLVKPAADLLREKGPRTPQERWEENGGYSPATLAAVVAGLFCAADLAERAGDLEGAAAYLAQAEEWNAQIENWTLTTSGPLGDGRYYLRITQGDPNSAETITIGNGGGVHDQRLIVDQSFLELVRLGVRPPDAPAIVGTLPEVDAAIRVETPVGPSWYRYPFDGYGEPRPAGQSNEPGQLWPLLTGERGVYAVAAGDLAQAQALLETMERFANQGGMLPEQVFPSGVGTGAATPLAWAHAEYVVLALSIAAGAVVDQPAIVAQHLAAADMPAP